MGVALDEVKTATEKAAVDAVRVGAPAVVVATAPGTMAAMVGLEGACWAAAKVASS